MAKLAITDFKGTAPVRAAHLLPDAYAQTALNTLLRDGALAPIGEPQAVYTFPSAVTSIYRHNADWLGWSADVDVVPGPVTDDRLYITGDGAPKMRLTGGTTRAMGLAPPATKPTVAFLGTLDSDNQESIVYGYTWVTDLGEESAPSPLSDIVQVSPGAAVRLSAFASPPAGRGVTKVRIYRSQTGTSGATGLFFVSEQSWPQTSYDHDVSLEPLQEAVSTAGYTEPPSDMASIVALPNGMMAAFSGREVLFCEPYKPYAWPETYRQTVNANIVGLAAFGSSLAVMTDASPYMVQGTHPENMSLTQIEEDLPCVAKQGIVDLGYAAAYPAPDGLVLISQGGARLVTKSLYSRHQWQALNPSSFRAARYDGRYLFSRQAETQRVISMIDMLGADVFAMETIEDATDLVYDPKTTEVLMLRGAGAVYKVDPGAAAVPKTLRWRSKKFQLPQPIPFGCAKAQGTPAAASPSFAMRVYADGTLLDTVTDLNAIVRLPPVRATEWEIEVETNGTLTAILLGGTPQELAS